MNDLTRLIERNRSFTTDFDRGEFGISSPRDIVALIFAMFSLSTFRVTAYMSLLTSLTVACVKVVDFLLLPAILLTFDRRAVKYPLPNAALVAVASGAD